MGCLTDASGRTGPTSHLPALVCRGVVGSPEQMSSDKSINLLNINKFIRNKSENIVRRLGIAKLGHGCQLAEEKPKLKLGLETMTDLDKREFGCELEPSLRPRVKMGLAVFNPGVQAEPDILPEQLGEDKLKLGLDPTMDLDKQELGFELETSLRPRVKMGLAEPNLDVQAEPEMLPEEVRLMYVQQ